MPVHYLCKQRASILSFHSGKFRSVATITSMSTYSSENAHTRHRQYTQAKPSTARTAG